MSLGLFILDGHTPVPVEDTITWATWFETAIPERVVAKDEIGDAVVSTVFLGIEHWKGMLFETLVFGGALAGEMDRYRTWNEAERGHAAMVARVQGELDEQAAEGSGA